MAGEIRVGVNGYGVIGKRVADAVRAQADMRLVGVSDVAADWRTRALHRKDIPLFAATSEAHEHLAANRIPVEGRLQDLLGTVDVVVDCTPKRVAAENVPVYRQLGRKFIVQGGEKHGVTGHSFVAESNYQSAVGLDATRVVSCNTTATVRTLTALKRAGLLRRARGTLMRRATDPWESHLGGIINTLVPEPEIPSHQGPDAQTVDPDLDVLTMAVKVPETIAHLHYWSVQLSRSAPKEEVLDAFRASPRIFLMPDSYGLAAINAVKELMADLGRSRGDLYEVALWSDMLRVEGDEVFYTYMVDNQAIVVPETIDAIRALAGREPSGAASIRATDEALQIWRDPFSPAPG
ncbi:MAG: type II glyceraldehyde-3-phosphate dehydrogenase [Phenylobacterium sp.]|jgi:glyceraldehyde-3-phosphate dehydrogenase (NAD(P))|uniref:type II glyceraldehyde-3-phosphate dehydrogenase n=1 Tax=Phenylobacterium sp. TaxID=1871053 RepID=UPI001810322D|nr:type II glyceraldehyde-3-phosphate dehydrogenase [Phenylobacterium sp.]MBA4793394.1 type II glyceraldehyde-3-phosphate dehydrogenase [Phenylobacterium sp.]